MKPAKTARSEYDVVEMNRKRIRERSTPVAATRQPKPRRRPAALEPTFGWSCTNINRDGEAPRCWWHWFPRVLDTGRSLSWCGRRKEHSPLEPAHTQHGAHLPGL